MIVKHIFSLDAIKLLLGFNVLYIFAFLLLKKDSLQSLSDVHEADLYFDCSCSPAHMWIFPLPPLTLVSYYNMRLTNTLRPSEPTILEFNWASK